MLPTTDREILKWTVPLAKDSRKILELRKDIYTKEYKKCRTKRFE